MHVCVPHHVYVVLSPSSRSGVEGAQVRLAITVTSCIASAATVSCRG